MNLGYLIIFINLIYKNIAITLEATDSAGKSNSRYFKALNDMIPKHPSVKPPRLTETVKGAG